MRLLMYIMLALNSLTFAWLNYHEPSPAAEKYERQAESRGVKMLRLLSEREPVMDVSAHVRDQAEAVGRCHTIGPLADYDLARDIVAEIKELGREGNIRTDRQKVKYAYWVYLVSMPDDELKKIIAELEANGIKDYHGNARNELSLGIYNGIQGARQRQMKIAALGYSPLVGPLYRTQTQYWIDIAEMSYSRVRDDAWETYLARYQDSQHKSGRCDLFNA
jgi:hypothetical protein